MNKGGTSEIQRESSICSVLRMREPVKCTHVCEKGEGSKTGSVGWEARIEGGLLRESSDLRQQVLEDGLTQKHGGSSAWKRGD